MVLCPQWLMQETVGMFLIPPSLTSLHIIFSRRTLNFSIKKNLNNYPMLYQTSKNSNTSQTQMFEHVSNQMRDNSYSMQKTGLYNSLNRSQLNSDTCLPNIIGLKANHPCPIHKLKKWTLKVLSSSMSLFKYNTWISVSFICYITMSCYFELYQFRI